MNDCSGLWPRFNREAPIDQPETLFHTGEAQASALERFFRFKADTGVMHYQLELVCATRKRHSEVSRATVLDSILESFLQNAKQTQRDFVGHLSWNTLGMKLDFNPLEF